MGTKQLVYPTTRLQNILGNLGAHSQTITTLIPSIEVISSYIPGDNPLSFGCSGTTIEMTIDTISRIQNEPEKEYWVFGTNQGYEECGLWIKEQVGKHKPREVLYYTLKDAEKFKEALSQVPVYTGRIRKGTGSLK